MIKSAGETLAAITSQLESTNGSMTLPVSEPSPPGDIQLSRSELDVAPLDIRSPAIFDCPICGNHGIIIRRGEQGRLRGRECECMTTRRNIRRIRLSGLENTIQHKTFSTFSPMSESQARAMDRAMEYAKAPSGWFMIGGRPGTGKTHLCTAICGELLQRGFDVRYVMWRELSRDAKAVVSDDTEYRRIIKPLQECKVLYLDDLFKTGAGRDRNGNRIPMMPTPADVNFAYELLNARYINPDSLTIISTELRIGDLMNVDDALGSRIYERARAFTVTIDGQNYRMRQ